MTGYVVGMIAAFRGVALLADRSEFLTKGILPLVHYGGAAIVGTAPIFVKWLGSDWQSAAVVGVMFFPILVNTIGGFEDTSVMQRDRAYLGGLLANLVQTAPACCVAIYV
jgi:NitT/TauT family transport system permease protein